MTFYFFEEGPEPILPFEIAAIAPFKDDIGTILRKINEELI